MDNDKAVEVIHDLLKQVRINADEATRRGERIRSIYTWIKQVPKFRNTKDELADLRERVGHVKQLCEE